MKELLPLLLLLHYFAAHSQSEYDAVDALARSTSKSRYDTPAELAKAMCKDLKTDREKARAIFTWIAENVRYDFKSMDYEPPKGMTKAQLEATRVERTYKKGKGVCQDYSMLYQNMAAAVGLECVWIPGNSRSLLRNTLGGHAWNAVKIDGQWRLLDATWGAGVVEGGDDFNQLFQPGYFLTEPRIFIGNHFPEDAKWQLLDAPIDKETFKKQPVISYGNLDHGIVDAEPLHEGISRSAEGKMQLKLKFSKPQDVVRVKVGTREVEAKSSEKDGWTVLEFSSNYGREVQVWLGERTEKGVHTKLGGVFPVK